MVQELRDILFIDIETVALTNDYSTLSERMKTQWARKAGFFKRNNPDQNDEDLFHERAGIYAEFGKIVCIAVGKFFDHESGEIGLKTKVYSSHDDKTLLNDFRSMLDKMDSSTLRFCAHNGKEFDYPYLCRRFLINGIPLPAPLNLGGKKSWEVQHLDTLELWKFGDYKHYTSLDLLACVFNIPSSKNNIDGSQVNNVYHQEQDLPRICEYCRGDVIVLAQLFLKLKGYPVVNDQQIITA
jgi:DNA polymerase elongation subunit (family B)